ncbi:MAG: M20/M25/M40 family metallo-hydrolase, partial [Candidatus Bipolaricaulota bacterium]
MNQRDRDAMIEFCQELVRTPSPSGNEGAVAALIRKEMQELNYDDVWVDEAGNVIGRIAGKDKSAPSLALTAHMDQVDVSASEDWAHDPFGGEIDGGYLHGRGASDTKGAIAAQVYVASVLREMVLPHGDVYVAQVVLEETGGLGTEYMLSHFDTDYAVMGEGTGNELRIGNRGRVLVRMTFKGESMHSSAAPPEDVLHIVDDGAHHRVD